MKSYRTTDGRFISKKQHDNNAKQFAKSFVLMIALAGVLGVVSTYMRGGETEASNMMTDEQLCSLHAVECEGEEVEYFEVGDALPTVTPAEVALWYMESNTKLLDIVINSGDIDALETILEEQHAYARAVMIVTK